jgi:hypothetical protein
MFPGFIKFFGSNARFNSRNAWRMVGPYTRSRYGLRARPSPCSLEIAPPNSITRSVISSAIALTCSSDALVFRLMIGRI